MSLELLNPRYLPYLNNGKLFTGAGNMGKVAAETSVIQIKNPAASGKILVVLSWKIRVETAAGTVSLFPYDTDLTLVSTLTNAALGVAASSAQFRGDTPAAPLVANSISNELAADTKSMEMIFGGIMLTPGKGLALEYSTVNQNIWSTIWCAEY